MPSPRLLTAALLGLAVSAAVPASIGAGIGKCGLDLRGDANLRRLDRHQSPAAAKICAIYLNLSEEDR